MSNQEEKRSEQQPVTVEDIQKKRAALEAKLTAVKKQKGEDLAKQLDERVAMVAEDKRLVPLIKEAKTTLKYFETQYNQGLVKDANAQAELEELRELVNSFEEQRRVALEKYDAIMSNEEVNDAVFEQAKKEDVPIEAKLQQEAAKKKFESDLDQFFVDFQQFAEELNTRNDALQVESSVTEQDEGKFVDKLIRDACVSAGVLRNDDGYERLSSAYSGRDLVMQAEELKKKASLFERKKKAVADFILRQKPKLLEFGERAEKYNDGLAQLKDFREKRMQELAGRLGLLEEQGRHSGIYSLELALEYKVYEKIYKLKKPADGWHTLKVDWNNLKRQNPGVETISKLLFNLIRELRERKIETQTNYKR